jgi:ketosteroid isomerase-like protein
MERQLKEQIEVAECQLMDAMLCPDISALDKLFAPELVFTNHLGHLIGKDDDLLARRSGLLEIKVLTPSEQQIQLQGDVAIVSVRMMVAGTFGGNPANGDFRFTRVWARSELGDLVVGGFSRRTGLVLWENRGLLELRGNRTLNCSEMVKVPVPSDD